MLQISYEVQSFLVSSVVLFRCIHTISVSKAACPGAADPVTVPVWLRAGSQLDPHHQPPSSGQQLFGFCFPFYPPLPDCPFSFQSSTQQCFSNVWSEMALEKPLLTFLAPFPE